MHSLFTATHNGKAVIVVVIHADSLGRMEMADPAVLSGTDLKQLVKGLPVLLLDVTDFLICYEPDMDIFQAKAAELADGAKLLKWLCRGWKSKPEDDLPTTPYNFTKH